MGKLEENFIQASSCGTYPDVKGEMPCSGTRYEHHRQAGLHKRQEEKPCDKHHLTYIFVKG